MKKGGGRWIEKGVYGNLLFLKILQHISILQPCIYNDMRNILYGSTISLAAKDSNIS